MRMNAGCELVLEAAEEQGDSFRELFIAIGSFAVMAFAGTVVLLSLALGWFVHPNWYWLAAFVGANLLQASFTGFCPLESMLRRLGVRSGGDGQLTLASAGEDRLSASRPRTTRVYFTARVTAAP